MAITKILIADSQYLTREGLKCIFKVEPQFKVIGETNDKHETFYLLKQLKPDILILNYNNLNGFGTEDIGLLGAINSKVHVLIIANTSDHFVVKQVMEQGVDGFLTNTCEREEIMDTMFALIRGKKMYCHKVLEIVLEDKNAVADCNASILSERELEIIQLIAAGYTTQQIAESLFRSYHTIATHRKNIMKKLQFKTTRELMLFAIQNVWVNSNATSAINI
ncbi:MAG TPA: response regulator transcription factor [Chitinophagales bacterium]|nr:response regulator transcription factor [Chitinophagales bacterium]